LKDFIQTIFIKCEGRFNAGLTKDMFINIDCLIIYKLQQVIFMKKLLRNTIYRMKNRRVQRAVKLENMLQRMKEQTEKRETLGRTPLMMAAERGDVEAAKFLIRNGVDVNARDTENWTPLVWATWMKQRRMIRLLKRNGADPSALYQDSTTMLMCDIKKPGGLKELKEQKAGA
jgi:ankyrin repeat protein